MDDDGFKYLNISLEDFRMDVSGQEKVNWLAVLLTNPTLFIHAWNWQMAELKQSACALFEMGCNNLSCQ